MTAAIRHPKISDPLARQVVSTVVSAIRPARIYLFGSRAEGAARPESDVDLLLVHSGSETPREIRLKTHRLFHDPVIPIDVFVLSPDEFEKQKHVPNTLAREVYERGILCHG